MTTVRDIAQESSLVSPSLYHYFDSKEDIAAEIIEAHLEGRAEAYEAIANATHDDPARALWTMIRDALASVNAHRSPVQLLLSDWHRLPRMPRFARTVELAARIDATWIEVLRRGRDQGVFRRDLDPEPVYRLIMGAILSTVRWRHPDGEIAARAMGAYFANMLVRGLLAPAVELTVTGHPAR